ncbi:hypothetical protein BDN70DRAFT_871734 [Pholiota conissans]|uniref:WW domain-containing protein n=1 Tax=Pholiota conissans TaxID=109636 RepID=A0A9P5ZDM5_9AGAR|nr:hypothetical protein BDN70DRAFT_871734 [Pholiota conissans]
MTSATDQLPQGWAAKWDATHQRYLFIETATGQTSLDPPAPVQAEGPPTASGSPQPVHNGKEHGATIRIPTRSSISHVIGVIPRLNSTESSGAENRRKAFI